MIMFFFKYIITLFFTGSPGVAHFNTCEESIKPSKCTDGSVHNHIVQIVQCPWSISGTADSLRRCVAEELSVSLRTLILRANWNAAPTNIIVDFLSRPLGRGWYNISNCPGNFESVSGVYRCGIEISLVPGDGWASRFHVQPSLFFSQVVVGILNANRVEINQLACQLTRGTDRRL